MRLNWKGYLFYGLLLLAASCQTIGNEEELRARAIIEEIRLEFAPDKRVAIFHFETERQDQDLVLKGESNLPKAVRVLRDKLNAQHIAFIDSIQLLPAAELEGLEYGVVSISVANLRGKPAHSSELVTQATLGTPVTILKTQDTWSYIQTPDRYLSWVDDGGIIPLTKEQFTKWKATDKIIYTRTVGEAYEAADKESQVVSDLVAGGILRVLGEKNGYFEVEFPDGRIAYVLETEARDYRVWLADLEPTQASLVKTSKTLMGVPYLWGGTSTKGVDCSGYTKMIYFLNGIVLPRDASQQVHTGTTVEKTGDFEKLVPGDLLFFGTPPTPTQKERVVHVGMWIGNNEFIHSSGKVHISSMDPGAPNFDEYNRNRYLRSNRYLEEPMAGLINLTKFHVFKD